MLFLIDDWLWAILLAYLDQPFRGINVLLCRDFFQLLLVEGKPLYSLSHSYLSINAIKGQQLY
jgi:hypothetical protein